MKQFGEELKENTIRTGRDGTEANGIQKSSTQEDEEKYGHKC